MKKYLLPLVMLPFLLFSETDVPLKKKSYFIHSKDNTTTTLFENVRILPNRKYRISCKVTNINPVNGNAQGCVVALDKKATGSPPHGFNSTHGTERLTRSRVSVIPFSRLPMQRR